MPDQDIPTPRLAIVQAPRLASHFDIRLLVGFRPDAVSATARVARVGFPVAVVALLARGEGGGAEDGD